MCACGAGMRRSIPRNGVSHFAVRYGRSRADRERSSHQQHEETMSKDGVCAIVTGSASGLGAATAGLLAKGGGARIVVNYSSSKTEAETTADHCRKLGADVVV